MENFIKNDSATTPLEFFPTSRINARTRFKKRIPGVRKLRNICLLNDKLGGQPVHKLDCSCCDEPSKIISLDSLKLQGLTDDIFDLFKDLVNGIVASVQDPITQKSIKEVLYTFSWVIGRLPKVADNKDILAILDYITRVHFGKQVGEYIVHLVLSPISAPSAQSFDWSILKDMVAKYSSLKNHPVVLKFIKMVALAFSSGIITTLGFSETNFEALWNMIIESCKILVNYTDFFAAIFDLVALIGGRIASFCATGSWNSFVHTPANYAKWADECYALLDKSAALSNPEAAGIDFHEYVGKLIALISQGEEMKKFIRAIDDKDIVTSLLSRLRVLHVDILVKGACGKMRMAPFSMLISAGSSVGKTSFTDVLFAHYSKLYNKKLEGGVYVRTAVEAHWNNFKSNMWGCLLDDVAFINPNTGTTDPSLADILQAGNNVHFSTPQAAIEDKGRTPFLCEIMLATTNTENLKAHVWFNNPQAVRRRFPYIVNILPKDKYRKPGTRMLDSTNVPLTPPGHYPDLWDITVSSVSINPREEIETTVILETDNIYTFIKQYNIWLQEHRTTQVAFLASRETVAEVTLCSVCRVPSAVCGCDTVLFGDIETKLEPQSGEELALQGAGLSVAANAAAVVAMYESTKFVANCMQEAVDRDNTIIEEPSRLIAGTAVVGVQRTQRFVQRVQERGVRYGCDLIKSALIKRYQEINPKLKTFVGLLGIVATIAYAWKRYKEEFPDTSSLNPQAEGGASFDINKVGITPKKGIESENVWRKDDYVPSEFLGRLSTSWGQLPLSQVASIVGRNVVWCRTSHGVGKHTVFRATCVVGHLYVVPHHVLPVDEYFTLQVIHDSTVEGCNGNIVFKMAQSLIYRVPGKELAFFEINHMPARRDLRSIFPKHGAKMDGPGRLVTRQANGSLDFINTKRSTVSYNRFAVQVNQNLDVALSFVERDTGNGECGSPLVIKHPNTCVIAGVHCFGGQENQAVSVMIFQEDIEKALIFYGTPPIDCDIPNLGAQAFTTNISPRCTARFLETGSVLVYGSFEAFKRQPKSTACDTVFTQYLLDRGHKRKFGPAPMKGYTAVHLALKSMVQKPMIFKEDVLRICAQAYTDEIVCGLASDDFLELKKPLSLKVALNGMPGVKFIDSMNFRSSAGFPRNKSKRDFIHKMPPDDIWQHPVEISQEIKDEVATLWQKMIIGVRCAPVFMQHLKDEALSLEKVRAGKARVFMGGPFAWSICVRMLLLPFVRVMQRHKYLFEAAPGTNTTSIEWTRLYQYLTKFGENRMIAGDFKSFDKNMGSLVIMLAFSIITNISASAGMDAQYILAIQTVCEDVAFAFSNYNGDLMQFMGSNPSGHPLTVIINCLVNSLYMRYCYHELHPQHCVKDFRNNVRLITYGDDNAMGSNVDWFNHVSISQILASVGIQYTMADKVSESVEFINIDKVSFLKRGFRWEPLLEAYAAPLEEDSIWKSMMIWIPSGEDSPQKQAIDIIRCAVSEWFFYGRERFEKEVAFLRQMVTDVGLDVFVEDGTFSSWDVLLARFNGASVTYLKEEPISTRDILGRIQWRMQIASIEGALAPQGLELQSPEKAKMEYNVAVTAPLLEYPQGMSGGRMGHVVCSPGRSPKSLFREDYGWQSQLVDYTRTYRCKCERTNSPANFQQRSIPDLQENPENIDFGHFALQSQELQDGHQSMQRQENLMFADAGLGAVHTTPMVSFKPDGDMSAGLSDFLSRPVAINSYSWLEGDATLLKLQFKPWKLFFNTTSIKSKLNNYARLRAKLHLKFVVNASPFYYGALRACYCPIDGTYRDIVESVGDQIKFSQMPGDMLYPADMSSFEMELPFLWPHAWIDITNGDDFDNLGQITYLQYSKLRSANGATGQNVTVTCYAWATDVELAGLTTQLALQSDEYEESGPISGPATAVANVAAKLNDVPVIGPLARATEIGARAVSGIASLFGYSNPPVIDNVHGFVPKSFHSFASVETGMPMDKLTIDPKNEITVDKTVTGAKPDDELIISHICGRKSYVVGALWTEDMTPGTQILRIPVTPRNYASNVGTSQSYINETPASHFAAMFSQWRGGMVYTLRFVKSRYHTGRVQISWDPTQVPTTNAETTTMTRIVDLQLETEVVFIVPFKANDPWLMTGNTPNNWATTPGGIVTASPTEFNGYIRITVLNELTGPATSQELDVLLFAHTADDFQLGVPNELPLWSFLPVQSAEEDDGVELAPVGSSAPLPGTNAVTVGETIASLRTILHRSSYYHREFMGNPYASDGVFNVTGFYNLVTYIPRFPVEYGYTAQGVNYATGILAATKNQFQFSPNHPINWITNCFAGYRGSIVHQYNLITNGSPLVDEFKVERDPRTHILDVAPRQAINRFSIKATTAQPSSMARIPITTSFTVTREIQGHRGMAITNTNTQSALSVVTPQYSKWKFRPAFRDHRDVIGGLSEQESLKVIATLRCGMPAGDQDAGWPILTTYIAGGVDFDPIYFIAVPTLYTFSIPNPDNTF